MTTSDETAGPLDRYMQVLELVATFPGALTLADVSSLLDLPKTSAHRLLKGLVRAGLAKDNVGGRAYQLGDRLLRLLHATADDGWIAALARGHLQQLTDTTSETCYLTRLIGARVVVAISISPDVRWRSYVQPGIEMPVHAAATAKAIIAYQSEAVLADAMSADLPLLTANTRNDRTWVEQELAAVRGRGYATCIGEIDEGLAAIAVPVFLSDRRVFYALGMTGPLQRIMNEQLPERLAALRNVAETVGRSLSIGDKLKSKDMSQAHQT